MTGIVERARKGMPLNNVFIIDCHCHMGYWHNFNVPNGFAEGMLESMDVLGINTACIAAHSSIGPDYRYGNDLVLDAIEKYPDRFIGYTTVNPNYPDDIGNELARCFINTGMKAIKLHPSFHRCPIDHKHFRIAYKTAHEKRCPILIHVWGNSDVVAVSKLAGQYPGASFIMGHGGAEIRAMEDAIDVTNKHENVYMDLAISLVREGNVEWLVKEVGSKKVLFGSDMPFFDPRPAVGRIAFAEISDEEKENILGRNMKALLEM